MATNNKWERHEHFQKYGVYPETLKREKDRLAKERDLAENGPTEEAHPAVSPQLANAPKVEETHTEKVVRLWHEQNPGFK
jgi:hypothetical protein